MDDHPRREAGKQHTEDGLRSGRGCEGILRTRGATGGAPFHLSRNTMQTALDGLVAPFRKLAVLPMRRHEDPDRHHERSRDM